MRRLLPGFALLASLVMVAACSSGSKSSAGVAPAPSAADPTPWPAPANPMTRARDAGLVPETAERLQYHVHAHLDVYVDGQHQTVPAGIGIDITNPGVHTFESNGAKSYGGISPACLTPCISPLHTHDIDGVLHTESATKKNNTLGQFFTEWEVKLDASCVGTYCTPATPIAIYVNGKKATGDPRAIELANLTEIAIVIGAPPPTVPSKFG